MKKSGKQLPNIDYKSENNLCAIIHDLIVSLHPSRSIFYITTGLLVIGASSLLQSQAHGGQGNSGQTNSEVASKTLSYNIPAGPLETRLNRFAEESGLLLTAPGTLTRSRRSNGLKGSYTVNEGLKSLLLGSGLRHRFVDGRTAVLESLSENTGSQRMQSVMVKSELQERTLQGSHTSVAVTGGDKLEQRSNEVFDVIERTAGAALGPNNEITIRGIRQRGFGGSNNVVTTRVDGAVVSNNTRVFANVLKSTWDLEQIEILRGPQSTQAGRNSLAGAVEIRSKDPAHEFAVKVRSEAGSADTKNGDTYGGALVVNRPLIENRLALRISAEYQESDGLVYNDVLNDDRYANGRLGNLRAGLLFEPADRLSAVLKYTRIDSKEYPLALGVDGLRFPDKRVISNALDRKEKINFESGHLRLGYQFSDAFRLESETTYSEGDSFTQTGFIVDQSADSIEQEIKLLYQSDQMRAVLGGFYANDETDSYLNYAFPNGIRLVRLSTRETTNYAGFIEIEYRMLPRLRIIAGSRYDRETRKNFGSSTFSAGFPNSAVAGKTTYKAFLPKLGVIYDFTDDISLGFTVQRGYRAGGAGVNLFTGQSFDFDPEYTRNYEVSLRSQWLENRLTINANLFYTDWKDQQVGIAGVSGNALDITTENAGESRVFGGELETRAFVNKNLQLFAAIGYVDTRFKDFISKNIQLAGNEFPDAPKTTAVLGMTYYFNDNVFFNIDTSYTHDAFGDVENTRNKRIDNRFLANVRLGYEADNWSVLAYADNLLDKNYIAEARQGRKGEIIAGDPRTFGVIGQIQF